MNPLRSQQLSPPRLPAETEGWPSLVLIPPSDEHFAPNTSSLVSGLTSAIVHMLALIALGLLFANLSTDGTVEIQMALATTQPSESIEMLDLAVEVELDSADQRRQSTSPSKAEIAIAEPTLVYEFGEAPPTEQTIDVTATISDAIDLPGGQASRKKDGMSGQFFGADAYGDEFVYVVDMSTSMGYASTYGQTRFRIACRELIRSINELTASQSFCVIMFSYRTRFMFDRSPKLIAATDANKKRLKTWISLLQLGGGTDPRLGVMTALKMRPDAIFLLSDGEFNGQGVNLHGIPTDPPIERIIKQHHRGALPIHTIAFEDLLNRRRLRRIATFTGGTHRFVGNVSDQDLVLMDLRSRKLDDITYAMNCLIAGTHKMRDRPHLQRVAALLGRKLTSSQADVRKLANQALVSVADGVDLGPDHSDPTPEEYQAAQQRWREYWERKLDRSPEGEVLDLAIGDQPAEL